MPAKSKKQKRFMMMIIHSPGKVKKAGAPSPEMAKKILGKHD